MAQSTNHRRESHTSRDGSQRTKYPGAVSVGVIFLALAAIPIRAEECLLKPEGPFRAGSAIDNCSENIGVLVPPCPCGREQGRVNGLYYTITYDHGGATVRPKKEPGNPLWSIDCKKDEMTDAKTCAIYGAVKILVRPDGVAAIQIGSKHYPGSSAYLRVDDYEPLESSKEGFFLNGAPAIVERMKRATQIRLRWYEWPYANSPVNRTIDNKGLTEALEIAIWVVSRIR